MLAAIDTASCVPAGRRQSKSNDRERIEDRQVLSTHALPTAEQSGDKHAVTTEA
jgi:hypothetical protein